MQELHLTFGDGVDNPVFQFDKLVLHMAKVCRICFLFNNALSGRFLTIDFDIQIGLQHTDTWISKHALYLLRARARWLFPPQPGTNVFFYFSFFLST